MNWESFREEIGKVIDALAPSDNKLALLDAITYPVKSHIDTLGAFGLDGIQCDAFGAFIIAKNDVGG